MTNVDETLLTNMEKVMAGEEPALEPEVQPEPWPRGPTPMPGTPPVTSLPKYEQPTKLSATQGIAKDITRLTWREAEAMGRSIEEKMKGKDGKASTITQAIQDWAWAWQTFKEEEQPK